MEFKKCIGLFQCTVVPRIPEFSPDSSILAFWGQDANVTKRVNKFSFKAKWFLLKLRGKQSNSQKGISWKRKRLKTVNKIEAKRTSNATREHATLIGIGAKMMLATKWFRRRQCRLFSEDWKIMWFMQLLWIELCWMSWEKLNNIALVSFHQEHNFCSFWGDVMFDQHMPQVNSLKFSHNIFIRSLTHWDLSRKW